MLVVRSPSPYPLPRGEGEVGTVVVDCGRGDTAFRGGVVGSFVDDWARGVRADIETQRPEIRITWERTRSKSAQWLAPLKIDWLLVPLGRRGIT
jgi:hypothetical protein